MVDWVTVCVTLLWMSVDNSDAGGCPSNGFPVIEMCKGESASGGTILLDFFSASKWPAPVCRCEVLVLNGKDFQFSQVAAPGYQGCGTEIHVQKNGGVGGEQGGRILKCYGGTSLKVNPGNTLSVTLYKHAPPMDTKYCYRLDMTGHPHASMSLTCIQTATPTAPLPSLPRFSSSRPSQSTTHPLTIRDTTSTSILESTERINGTTPPLVPGQSDHVVQYVVCSNTNYLTAVVLLATSVGVLSVYAVIVTYKLSQRPKNPSEGIGSNYTDIYEEIPAKEYMSSRPVYNDSFNSHTTMISRSMDPLPDLPPTPPCQNCSNVSLIPIPQTSSSVWNWTYNDTNGEPTVISGVQGDNSVKNEYDVPEQAANPKQEYDFPRYDYENVRF